MAALLFLSKTPHGRACPERSSTSLSLRSERTGVRSRRACPERNAAREVEGPVLIPRRVTLYRAECPVIPTISLFCHPSVMPDSSIKKMSRTNPVGHPASFAIAKKTRKPGQAHRPAPTHRPHDSVGDDLRVVPCLSKQRRKTQRHWMPDRAGHDRRVDPRLLIACP